MCSYFTIMQVTSVDQVNRATYMNIVILQISPYVIYTTEINQSGSQQWEKSQLVYMAWYNTVVKYMQV